MGRGEINLSVIGIYSAIFSRSFCVRLKTSSYVTFSAESTFTDLGQLFALISFFFVGFTLVTDRKSRVFILSLVNWIKVFFVLCNEFVGIKRSLYGKKYLEFC